MSTTTTEPLTSWQRRNQPRDVLPAGARRRNADGSATELVDLIFGEGAKWQDAANCKSTDGDVFFPEKGESTNWAKRVCGRCEVRAECLEYALAADERFGVWGGLSERERRKLKRRAA